MNFRMPPQCRESTGVMITPHKIPETTKILYLPNFYFSLSSCLGERESCAFPMLLFPQCDVFSRAVVAGKSLSPPYQVAGGRGGGS